MKDVGRDYLAQEGEAHAKARQWKPPYLSNGYLIWNGVKSLQKLIFVENIDFCG